MVNPLILKRFFAATSRRGWVGRWSPRTTPRARGLSFFFSRPVCRGWLVPQPPLQSRPWSVAPAAMLLKRLGFSITAL